MEDNKEYITYSQLLKDIDSLNNKELIDNREDIIMNLKELCGIAYRSLGLDTTLIPENHRWVLLKNGDEENGGAIFTDLSQIVQHVHVSYKTILRRVNEHGGDFVINGFRIVNLPYYKSKRGPKNGTD